MHVRLVRLAFGWLTVTGALHFCIDVVAQHLRGLHPPGAEITTLHHGLHSAYALGQVALRGLALLVAPRAFAPVAPRPVLAWAPASGLGWMVVSHVLTPYWQPAVNAGVFCALVVAA